MVEYFGSGVESLSATGMATICNMGAEMGATTSVFPYTSRMGDYLSATNRKHQRQICDEFASSLLSSDPGCKLENIYHDILTINLSDVEPHINGPFSPDASTPISLFAQKVRENGWNPILSAGLIGSCTNSSYEDMSRANSLVKQGNC